ncbi:MAG TPA: mechanosensitive ion channel protein MscS, partial [Gammaproteobacteria bacterium]|nr:mechanosensitive ion channel protein MscS [Gammaproteobacteria bacterium]
MATESANGQYQAWIQDLGIPSDLALWMQLGFKVVLVIFAAWVANLIAKKLLLRGVGMLVSYTESRWDDTLQKYGVFDRLASFAPATVLYLSAELVFATGKENGDNEWVRRLSLVIMVLLSVRILDALIDAGVEYIQDYDFSKEKPVRGYAQIAVLAVYLVGGIFILSILLDKEPWGLLTGLGAMSAVLLLVFRDTILGLVASIQINANDMVRRGDWIEMPQKGADGDVLDITLHTVKVQNWDKTISTIPTQALINESFKNWRGMSESGGRRIKRSIYIDQDSIRFCDDKMLERWRRSEIIGDYIAQKLTEIEVHNQGKNLETALNGRRLTNIGTFRAYVEAYLRSHPDIQHQMTLLVRQLPPTAQGLPIEIYCFSALQNWDRYESLQADIIDHLISVLGEFGLRIFQYPTTISAQQLNLDNPDPT